MLIIFFSITWGIHFFSVYFLWIKLMLILWALFSNKNSCLQTFSFFCKASLWFNYCIACLVLCSGLNRLYHGIAPPPRKQNYAWTSGFFNFTRFDNLLCLFSGIMSIPSCTYSLPFVQAWPSHSLSLCLNCNIGWRLAVDISRNKFYCVASGLLSLLLLLYWDSCVDCVLNNLVTSPWKQMSLERHLPPGIISSTFALYNV